MTRIWRLWRKVFSNKSKIRSSHLQGGQRPRGNPREPEPLKTLEQKLLLENPCNPLETVLTPSSKFQKIPVKKSKIEFKVPINFSIQ